MCWNQKELLLRHLSSTQPSNHPLKKCIHFKLPILLHRPFLLTPPPSPPLPLPTCSIGHVLDGPHRITESFPVPGRSGVVPIPLRQMLLEDAFRGAHWSLVMAAHGLIQHLVTHTLHILGIKCEDNSVPPPKRHENKSKLPLLCLLMQDETEPPLTTTPT